MTDREGWSLRGPVHTCRIQRTWYSRRCGTEACETEETGDITNLQFLANGFLERRWHHNPDGSETASYEYNDAGLLAIVRSENAAGLVDLKLYEYSNAGQLLRVTARPNGGGHITESYEYGSTGRKKKQTRYADLASQPPNTHYAWRVEGTDGIYSAQGAATLTTLYNEREQPTNLHFHDAAGRLLSRVEFQYDSEGHVIEEAQTDLAEMFPAEMLASLTQAQLQAMHALLGAEGEPILRMHRYNEQGRRAESRSRIGNLRDDKKIVSYNDYGDQVEEISEEDQREYRIDDEGRLSDAPASERVSRSEARFRYDYDAFGNWVMKTVESRGGMNQDFSVSSVERRTIGYFE